MDKYQPSTRITIKKEIKTPMEAETHNYKIKKSKEIKQESFGSTDGSAFGC